MKNVDVKSKIVSLQCSWVKKLYDHNHHDWKIIPLFFINKYFGKHFHFYSNLFFNLALVDSFPEFYEQIFINWSNCFVTNSEVPSCIESIFLWCNKHILFDNKTVYLSSFSDKNVNFINNLLDYLGNFKSWNVLKTKFKLADSLHFSLMQLINPIPWNWKTIIKHNSSSANLLLLNQNLGKKKNLILHKLHCRELYTY